MGGQPAVGTGAGCQTSRFRTVESRPGEYPVGAEARVIESCRQTEILARIENTIAAIKTIMIPIGGGTCEQRPRAGHPLLSGNQELLHCHM